MLSKLIPFTALAMVLVSCSKGSKEGYHSIEYGSTFLKTDSISLNLDSRTPFEFLNVSYFENDTIQGLFCVNYPINGFNLYDLNSQKMISQVSIPIDGPFSVRNFQGITVKSLDSIYIFSKGDLRKIPIVDYKGTPRLELTPKHFINLKNETEEIAFLNHQSITSAPSSLYQNKIFFTKYAVFDYNKLSNINSDYSEEFYLDLKTLELKELPVGFPNWLLNKSIHISKMVHSKTVNENGEIVYAIRGGDSIRVFNPIDYTFKAYPAKYSKDNLEDIFYKKRPTAEQQLNDGLESYLYTQVIYDKYRDVYYRIVGRPIRYNSKIHKNHYSYYYKHASCIILNADFKKIGEFDFEEDVHRAYGLFVGRKGLYVPKLHANYKNLSEDRVEYSIYSLVSK